MIKAEITWIDTQHKLAVLVLEPNEDAIMLPLDLLPGDLYPGQKITITIQ